MEKHVLIPIGIAGLAKSGKDTFANMIVNEYIHQFQKEAFAEPLKRICIELFDLTWEQVYDNTLKEKQDERWNLSPRQIMQEVGVSMRDIDDRVWVMPAMNKIQNSNKHLVFADVRFDNEAEMIYDMGGFVVLIKRDINTKHKMYKHESEHGISEDLVDIVIENNGTLNDLRRIARKIGKDILDEQIEID